MMKTNCWSLILVVAACVGCGTTSNESNPAESEQPEQSSENAGDEGAPTESPTDTSSPEESPPACSGESCGGDSEMEEETVEEETVEEEASQCGIVVECHCCTEDEDCYGHGAVECSALVPEDKGPGYVWFDGMESTTNFCTTGTFRRYDEMQGRGRFHYSGCHPETGDCLCGLESGVDCEAEVVWDCRD